MFGSIDDFTVDGRRADHPCWSINACSFLNLLLIDGEDDGGAPAMMAATEVALKAAVARFLELAAPQVDALCEYVLDIIESLSDGNGYVRRMAVTSFGKIGGKAAFSEALLRLLELSHSPCQNEVRMAVEALGELGEKAATPSIVGRLCNLCRDEDAKIREFSIDALMNMGEKAAASDVFATILELTRNPDLDVRLKAADALAAL